MTATPALTAVPNLLCVAGSDPSGGAGVQADLKTFTHLGVYGAAVVTALTAQSTRGVSEVLPLPPSFVVAQLEAVLGDSTVHAVKVGMLGSAAVARAVAEVLETRALSPVVIDPVLRASTGESLFVDDGLPALRDELLPYATVVTPNAAEAGALLGNPTPSTVDDMKDAARAIVRLGPSWALVTGGHVDAGTVCVDVLSDGEEVLELRVPRVQGHDPHGTGCTLTSAIATLLALGSDVPTACGAAQRYVAACIDATNGLEVGPGHRPLRQLPWASADEEFCFAMERTRRRWGSR